MKKIICIVLGGIFLAPLGYWILGFFLSFEKPVQSPYVLLEGWISKTILEEAADYIVQNNIDSVFIVDMSHSIYPTTLEAIDKTRKLSKGWKGYAMYGGGILGFEIPSQGLTDSLTIKIKMQGTPDAYQSPHYQLFLNTKIITSGFVSDKDSVYNFKVSKGLTDSIKYILINFDNDIKSANGDRNLFISELIVGNQNIDSIALQSFYIPATSRSNPIYISDARKMKYYLGDLGYDTAKVKIIKAEYKSFNKTLAFARGAQSYFSNTEINNINMLAYPYHSARTYLNFKNCLKKNMEVGSIAINPYIPDEKPFYHSPDERLSLLATWIYWWFH